MYLMLLRISFSSAPCPNITERITAGASCRSQLDACANHGTGWVYDNEPKQRVNVDNMSCQLKSVEEVGKLWEAHYLKHPEEYAGVVFMRPDVQYQCDFPVHVIPDLKVCSWLSDPSVCRLNTLLHLLYAVPDRHV